MNPTESTNCKWHSPDGRHRCKRPVYGNSDYCLFHKSDKDEAEGKLFWKVIHYNPFAGFTKVELEKQASLTHLYHQNRPEFERWEGHLLEKSRQAEILNFSEAEQADSGFDELRNRVKTLYMQSKTRPWSEFMNYMGFIFPAGEDECFSAFNFPADYPSGSLTAYYDFSYARFEGRVFFIRYVFPKMVSFEKTEFCQAVMFQECVFSGTAIFKGTKSLSNNMMGYHLFESSLFSGGIVIFEDLEQLDLTKTTFSRDTRLQIRNVLSKRPRAASEVYRRAQEQCVVSGQFKEAQEYQYLSLECHRNGLMHEEISDVGKNFAYCLKKPSHVVEAFKNLWIFRSELKNYLLATVFKWTTGYLLRPWRVVFTMMIVILCMSAIYPFVGISYIDDVGIRKTVTPSVGGFGLSIYFSVVTFTTLGYGDFSPCTDLARVFCNVESFLGIILPGLLVVSLAKQVLRE